MQPAGGETEAGGVAGSLRKGKEQNSARLGSFFGFSRAPGCGTLISWQDQLPDGSSCPRRAVETAAVGPSGDGFFPDFRLGTAWEAGKQSRGDRQRSGSRLCQSSWKDQLEKRGLREREAGGGRWGHASSWEEKHPASKGGEAVPGVLGDFLPCPSCGDGPSSLKLNGASRAKRALGEVWAGLVAASASPSCFSRLERTERGEETSHPAEFPPRKHLLCLGSSIGCGESLAGPAQAALLLLCTKLG